MRFNFSTIRRWLTFTLLLSNLVLGGLSFILLRELDSQYSNLIDRSVPIMARLHGISIDIFRSRRAMQDSLMAKTDAERTVFLSDAIHYEDLSAKLRRAYQRSPDLINGEAEDVEIEAVAREYKTRMDQFIALMRAGRIGEAEEFRNKQLREVVDRYFDLIEKRVTQIEARAEGINQTYTQGSGFRSRLVLVIASWPVVAIFGVGGMLLFTLLGLLAVVFSPSIFSRKTNA